MHASEYAGHHALGGEMSFVHFVTEFTCCLDYDATLLKHNLCWLKRKTLGDNMRISQSITASLLAGSLLLTGCDGGPIKVTIDIDTGSSSSEQVSSSEGGSSSSVALVTACDRLALTYYSAELEVGGQTLDGTQYSHWQMDFIKGEVHHAYTDVIEVGSYACINDEVVMTIGGSETTLAFNGDYTEFEYQGVTYVAPESLVAGGHCSAAAGNAYQSGDFDPGRPEEGPTILEFIADSQEVIFGCDDICERGRYECDTGTMHVHLDGGRQLDFYVERHGISVTLLDGSNTTFNRVVDDPVSCTEEYAPVCAVRETGVVCVTEPCPTHEYATYGNRCKAKADNAIPVFNGECGDLEGEPFYDQVVCPAVYLPVCAKAPVDIQCVTTPCPNTEYKTFGNSCEAGAKALVSFEAECDEVAGLAGQLSFRDTPVKLVNIGGEVTSVPLPRNESIRVIESSIADDVLSVTLGYSGCDEQPIDYYVDASVLLTSLPLQVAYSFKKQTEDFCDAYFETTFTYDLLPLRYQFKAEVEGNGLAILGIDGPLYQRPAAH